MVHPVLLSKDEAEKALGVCYHGMRVSFPDDWAPWECPATVCRAFGNAEGLSSVFRGVYAEYDVAARALAKEWRNRMLHAREWGDIHRSFTGWPPRLLLALGMVEGKERERLVRFVTQMQLAGEKCLPYADLTNNPVYVLPIGAKVWHVRGPRASGLDFAGPEICEVEVASHSVEPWVMGPLAQQRTDVFHTMKRGDAVYGSFFPKPKGKDGWELVAVNTAYAGHTTSHSDFVFLDRESAEGRMRSIIRNVQEGTMKASFELSEGAHVVQVS